MDRGVNLNLNLEKLAMRIQIRTGQEVVSALYCRYRYKKFLGYLPLVMGTMGQRKEKQQKINLCQESKNL